MSSVSKAFSQDGALAQAIPNFNPREAQVDMARSVEAAITKKEQLVVEAGTGTGKTFAYLVPALLSGKKVIVSTGTKALQEQLFHRDLPTVHQALASGAALALLKGRSNYLCKHRLDQHLWQRNQFHNPELVSQLVSVQRWSNETDSGDLGELTSLPEDAMVIPFVTSTAENCLGKDCPHVDNCHMVKARRKALDADLVVVNHHLFFADMALKDTGFGELIPDAQLLIFDEAHQLPDIAATYFGETFSSRQAVELGKDIRRIYLTEVKDMRQLGKVADQLEKVMQDTRLVFPENPTRGNLRDQLRRGEIQEAMQQLLQALDFCYEVLKLAIGRSKELDLCFERASQQRGLLQRILDIKALGFSYWFETTKRHFTLNMTPLNVSERFGRHVDESSAAWVFTSATLQVGHSFNHFTGQLGINDASTLCLSSPFDYDRQALMYVPRIPEKGRQPQHQVLLDAALPVIDAAKGGCFFLFTSYRMLHEVEAAIEGHTERTILVQGSMPKRLLLKQFVEDGNALLLATASFWEGVDVQGEALACVIIDKLPFAAPDEPLLNARIEDCRLKGRDPFAEVQIPQAVIALKQGAGRLIRDIHDRGVLMICDPRLVSRRYGQTFLASLPPMPRTRSEDNAVEFLTQL